MNTTKMLKPIAIKYKKFRNQINNLIVETSFDANICPVKNGKIKIVFLFQVASFWSSWETFWNECVNDEHLEVKMVLLDKDFSGKSQMKTAREFLEKNNIQFIEYKDYEINKDIPHVMVFQTPYDIIHRPPALWSKVIKSKGIRVVYIPYGIEISDTENSRKVHFSEGVPLYAWRNYTYSELIKKDYKLYSPQKGKNVSVAGHPKFDGLYYQEKFPLQKNIKQKAKGRKIVLWKVHFPKLENVFSDTKKSYYTTPEFEEYKQFLAEINNHPDLFFIFMPHPNFFDMCIFNKLLTSQEAEEMKKQLNSMENLYYYMEDDYRPGLLNSDCIIIDRSAIMVEAAITGKPILFMHNKDYFEPLTKAISGLIDAYYKGTSCKDMIDFLEMFKRNEDMQKEQRINAAKKYIPLFDGQSGKRIKEDIISSIYEESGVKQDFKVKIAKKIIENSKIKEILEENELEVKEKIIKFLKKKKFQKRIEKLAKKYKNKKIMFYGAGMVFDAICETFDISSLNIIGIADKKFENSSEFKGYPAFSSVNFMKQNPDIVLINLLQKEIAENYFKNDLFPVFGKFKFEPFIENDWDYITNAFS